MTVFQFPLNLKPMVGEDCENETVGGLLDPC